MTPPTPKTISPQCRHEVHETCVWFEVTGDYRRKYWCECSCHDAGSTLDLTASPTPERSDDAKELVSQE